jgi:hypothetical protein
MRLRRVSGLILILVILLGMISSCDDQSDHDPTMGSTTIYVQFTDLENSTINVQDANKYVEDSANSSGSENLDASSKGIINGVKLRFDKIDTNNATANITVISCDIEKIINDAIKSIEDENPTGDYSQMRSEVKEKISAVLAGNDYPTTSQKITVELVKIGENWKIRTNSEWDNAISGSMIRMIKSLFENLNPEVK